MKKQDVNEEEWNYLIILDACRYDIFKEVYSEFLCGNLNKRKSPGSSTTDWLEKSFTENYDYLYISGNPFINSSGHSLSQVSTGYYSDWKATDHFSEIVDSWKLDWNNEYETVLPEDITKRAVRHLDDKRKTIIHYMQPHRPYIKGDVEIENIGLRRAFEKAAYNQTLKEKMKSEVLSALYSLWKRLDISTQFRIKRFLGKEAKTEKFILEGGKEKILEYYRQNLREALRWIKKLLPYLDGKVIITADHGEAFGEDGIWWHEYRENSPILLEVPWFEVDMDKHKEGKEIEIKEEVNEERDEKIMEKLKKLGYS